jgi:hypothetical protein
MKRVAFGVLAAAVSAAAGCAGSGSPKAAAASPVGARAPYDAPAAGPHAIAITIDSAPAREILASLSRPRVDASDVKVLEAMPAVHIAIEDSGRPPDTFERDFAAAFEEGAARASVFDFQSVRNARERWKTLLDGLASREADLSRLSVRRAAALLPAEPVVSATVDVAFTFGVSGLGDHLVGRTAAGRDVVVVDLARALGDSGGEPLDGNIARLSRLIAGEAFRQAWAKYRQASPGWRSADPSLGDVAPLLVATAEAGPVSLYSLDENFFPTYVWLKEPMRHAIDDFNRRADRFAEARDNLERRVELLAESRRPDFRGRVAGPAGAFMTDAIVEVSGIDALRSALARGPRAFFQAYDRATQSNGDLIPLAKSVRDRLHP